MIDPHGAKSFGDMVPDGALRAVGYLLIFVGSFYAGRCIVTIVRLWREIHGQ